MFACQLRVYSTQFNAAFNHLTYGVMSVRCVQYRLVLREYTRLWFKTSRQREELYDVSGSHDGALMPKGSPE